MRNSFVSWLTAAAIVFGFSIAGANAANAQSVMRTCATEWKQAQTAGTTGGEDWPQFLAQCRTRQGSAAAPSSSTAAPAPSPQSGSLFPWSQPSAPTSTAASNAGAPSSGQSVMRLCASQWKEAKTAGTTAGQTWPQFLTQCRRRQTSTLRPREVSLPRRALPQRPLLPPSQDLFSHGGNSRRPLPRPHRMSLPRPCRQANTRRSSRRVLAAPPRLLCGSIRRPASIIIREPATTGTPSRAHICARLTRVGPAIVRRGTVNVRLRLIRDLGRRR